MARIRERFGLIVGIVLCSVLPSGFWRDITVPIATVVLSVKGTVLFGNAERNRFETVTTKTLIRGGDTVRAMEGASVDLLLFPGALAQLLGNSEIKIEQLTMVKDGNETSDGLRDRSAHIRLQRGKIILLFYRSDTTPSQLIITTGDLTVSGNSDSLFMVWTDGTKARVTCAKKNVLASADAQPSITASAGYFLPWPASNTKPLVAADDPSAQIDVDESLQAGEQLQSEWSAWQNRQPF
ncbi:MAG TPA: hypothetical protein VH227_00360 [Candidatus Udaeobacter sp.]|jgi:hypothetical protein|nr:hypothetical protein [Candidatus Udaeobacter sp.]